MTIDVRPKRCPVFIAFKTSGKAVPVLCKQWSCPTCAKKLAFKWARIARKGVEHYQNSVHFFTFTMGSRYRSVNAAYAALPRLWNKLRMKMQREHDGVWEYLSFVEGQAKRNGMPHFHILSVQPIPRSFGRIKDFAVNIGFGFQATDIMIDKGKATRYVAKYASKGDPRMPKRFRRVRVSRQWYRESDNHKRDAYIVRARREDYWSYIARVSRETGVDAEQIAAEYVAAVDKYMEEPAIFLR